MNKLSLIGNCQQVVMINLSAIKSHVKKTFRPFQILTEKPFNRSIYFCSIFQKYALLCFQNSFES